MTLLTVDESLDPQNANIKYQINLGTLFCRNWIRVFDENVSYHFGKNYLKEMSTYQIILDELNIIYKLFKW